ncbi:DUF2207 domain-containing protein [Enterobacillus tribolii]|nr:DUF2207 domain-containing protein [Enterobacillus tribolii]
MLRLMPLLILPLSGLSAAATDTISASITRERMILRSISPAREMPVSEPAVSWGDLLLPTQETWGLWVPVLLLALYYFGWWLINVVKPGLRMPAVVPRHDVPDGMTPGFIRYISKRRYDNVGFSGDLLDLVARQVMTYSVQARQGPSGKGGRYEKWIAPGPRERANRQSEGDKRLLGILFSGTQKRINLSVPFQKPMQDALAMLENHYGGQRDGLFKRRFGALWRGIGLLVLIPVICGIFFDAPGVWAAVLTCLLFLAGTWIIILVVNMLRAMWRRRKGPALFASLLILSALVWLGVVFMPGSLPRLPAGYYGALLSGMLIITFYMIRAPRYTQAGLDAQAVAQGLKMYLGTAEERRFETLYPPDQRITHFERMLPYALVLGVGKTWADTFARYLAENGCASKVFADASWSDIHSFGDSCHSASMSGSDDHDGGHSHHDASDSGSSDGGSDGGGD